MVRLGYTHTETMAMDEAELAEWLDVAVQYNKLTEQGGNR